MIEFNNTQCRYLYLSEIVSTHSRKKKFYIIRIGQLFLTSWKSKKFSEVIDADRPSFTFNTDKDRETSKGFQKVMSELVKVEANQILDWTNYKKRLFPE
jgi:hypothetical protein